MVNRQTYPTDYGGCDVSVVTERMRDGAWAVVATVRHHTDRGTKVIPLAVPRRRFVSEEEARQFGLAQANRWLARSLPAA